MPDYISQLTLGGRIGGGHFGEVFEAVCPLHGKVAVKQLKQNPGESPADWALRSNELMKEAIKLKTARHANVVEVVQVVKDTNGVVHLVAEFCNGGSVEATYKKGPLPVLTVRKIITDTCRGLECIHNRQMIHRDIKPGNIFGHDGAFKIGDFGLVSDRLLLGYGSTAGYINHLAPEVLGSPGLTSIKTDIWAVGMTVYRLLHGHGFYQDVFGFVTSADMHAKILNGGFGQKLLWLPHVSDDWRRFVRKAMHDDSAQRFQSAHDMSQALALLSVIPNWQCDYKFDRRIWKRTVAGRTITVEWRIHSPRKHEWTANRSGGGKRTVCIGGKPGRITNSTTAIQELEEFFRDSL